MKEKIVCKICNGRFHDKEIISHIIKNHQHELAGNMKRFQINRDGAISLMIDMGKDERQSQS